MSDRRDKALSAVEKVYKHKEQQELLAMAQRRQQLSNDEVRLGDLKGWLQQYCDTGHELGSTVSASSLSGYQQFLSRLSLAIDEQSDRCEQSVSMLDVQTRRWQEQHVKSESITLLRQKLQQKKMLMGIRAEQKITDEFRSSRDRL